MMIAIYCSVIAWIGLKNVAQLPELCNRLSLLSVRNIINPRSDATDTEKFIISTLISHT